MPTRRFPVGDGREIVLSWRVFSSRIHVRLDDQPLGDTTRRDLVTPVFFQSSDNKSVQVVGTPDVPYLPLFDVYYDGRLLEGSAGEPAWARRNLIDVLAMTAAYDVASIWSSLLHAQLPGDWLGMVHFCSALIALAIMGAVFSRRSEALWLARNFALLRCVISIFGTSSPPGFQINIDAGAFLLYFLIRHATRALETAEIAAAKRALLPLPADA